MDFKINFNGNKKQKEVAKYWFDNNTTNIVFSGGKSSGKKYIAINLLFIDAFSNKNTKYFIATKYIKSFFKYTHDDIEPILNNLGINGYCRFNIIDYCWEFSNGSTIQYLDISFKEKDPYYNRFDIMNYDKGWILQADELETNYGEDIYEERCIVALNNSVKKSNNRKILHTCVPCDNYLYNDFYEKYKNGTLEDNNKIVISTIYDSRNNMLEEYYNEINNIINNLKPDKKAFGYWE